MILVIFFAAVGIVGITGSGTGGTSGETSITRPSVDCAVVSTPEIRTQCGSLTGKYQVLFNSVHDGWFVDCDATNPICQSCSYYLSYKLQFSEHCQHCVYAGQESDITGQYCNNGVIQTAPNFCTAGNPCPSGACGTVYAQAANTNTDRVYCTCLYTNAIGGTGYTCQNCAYPQTWNDQSKCCEL